MRVFDSMVFSDETTDKTEIGIEASGNLDGHQTRQALNLGFNKPAGEASLLLDCQISLFPFLSKEYCHGPSPEGLQLRYARPFRSACSTSCSWRTSSSTSTKAEEDPTPFQTASIEDQYLLHQIDRAYGMGFKDQRLYLFAPQQKSN